MKKVTYFMLILSLFALSVSCSSDRSRDEGFSAQEEQSRENDGMYESQDQQEDALGIEEEEARDEIYQDESEAIE